VIGKFSALLNAAHASEDSHDIDVIGDKPCRLDDLEVSENVYKLEVNLLSE
jgi:hypothetical protein